MKTLINLLAIAVLLFNLIPSAPAPVVDAKPAPVVTTPTPGSVQPAAIPAVHKTANLAGNHSYGDHYAAAQDTGRLVVLVSADYCYACQTAKAALNATGEPYAVVDVDSPTARRLFLKDEQGNAISAIPQTFLIELVDGEWKKTVRYGSWDINPMCEFLGVEPPKSTVTPASYAAPAPSASEAGAARGGLIRGWRFPVLRGAAALWQGRPRLFGGCGLGGCR